MPLMFPNAQFMTATCTKEDQIVAMVWAVNMVRGGTFMYWPSLRS